MNTNGRHKCPNCGKEGKCYNKREVKIRSY